MKLKTISFYTNLVSKAIKNGNSLKKQCEYEGLNVNTAYKTLSSLKNKDSKTKEEEDLINLYETLTSKETKSTNIETDDRATITEIRDDSTNELVAYKFEIYRRDKEPIIGTFTADEMQSIYAMYSYYGEGLTQRQVSRLFPEYSLVDFRRILRAFNITKSCSCFAPHMYEKYTEEQLEEMHLRIKENNFLKKAEKNEIKDLKAIIANLAKNKSVDYEKFREIVESSTKTEYKELPVELDNQDNNYPDLIIWLSDLHIGAYNAKYSSFIQLPSYDIKEIKSRFSRIVSSFAGQSYHSIYVVNLGDAVDGYNKETTRGGHELPEILDNKEISEAFIECMMEFFATLTSKVHYDKINYLSIGEANHDGDFGWLNQKLLASYLTKYDVNSYISNKPIDSFIIGKHCWLFMHGKDNLNQSRQFPLTLNPNTELWFNNYIAEKGIKSERIYVVKGDLHNYAYTTGKQFDYISVGSMYGSSNYIVANFGHTKWSINYTVVKQEDILMGTIKGNV